MKRLGVAMMVVSSIFLVGFMTDVEPIAVTVEEGVSEKAVKVNNRGVDLFKEGKLVEAFANFVTAAEIDELFWEAHYNCAVALLAMGKPEEALHHLELSLAIDPEKSETIQFYNNLLEKIRLNA
ncbi:MAG: tetratricopeptide repeat protein [Nitrospiria bacterium]